jgi:WD40 repeat protein
MILGGSQSLNLRDLSSGKIIKTLAPSMNGITAEPFPDAVTAGAFSADGNRLVTGDACNGVFVFSTMTGKVLREFQPEERVMDYVNSIMFSLDGKTIAAGTSYGKVKLLDAETGKLKHSTIGHANLVSFVTFSPNGRILATGSYDRTVKLWDAASGRLLVTLMILPAEKAGQVAAEWIAFTPEGYYSASPGVEHFIRWRVGDKLLPAESYARQFNRTDLVLKSLRGGQ